MILRYPDGRPDVTVSAAQAAAAANGGWPPQSKKAPGVSPTTYHHQHSAGRSQPGSHGHHPSNPNMHSRVPSNAVPLYVTPPPPVIASHPETIHVRPSPTSPLSIQQSTPNSYFPPDPHNDPAAPPRSRSIRSSKSKRPQVSLQMMYSPPVLSSQSHSAPVSPAGESFQPTQPPPPLPHPPPPIMSPSPMYGFPTASSPPEPPQAAPPTGSGRTHSRTHSYSSNHSYPHPPAQLPNNAGPPPTLYHSGSTAQRPRRHSSRAGSHVDLQQSSSHNSNGISPSRRHGHGPPSIVYAPSVNSSLYAYNPPIITSHPPPSMTIHAPTPHHAQPQRMAQSISDPTPIGGSLGRSSTRGRLFEDFSRTPSPNTARARAKEEKKNKSRRDKLRRKGGGGRGADNDDLDDGASVSSGSTYYVLPSPGQKIKVVVSVLLYCPALALRRQDLSNCLSRPRSLHRV